MKTGMLAAEAAFAALGEGRAHDELADYGEALAQVVGYDDLYKVRNVKPRLKWGMWAGTMHGGIAHVARTTSAWGRSCRGRCATASRTTNRCRPRAEAADRLSEVRRRDDVRQAVVGIPVQHESRREPAGAPALRDASIPVT